MPTEAWANLSPAEKAATNKAKAAGNKKGDVVVDHEAKANAGKWDKINLTKKGGSKTVKQGVKAVRDWHKNNPHKKVKSGSKKAK